MTTAPTPAPADSGGTTTTIGMVGLGRMGAAMVRRLRDGGVDSVVFDVNPDVVADTVAHGFAGATDLAHLVEQLPTPRSVWIMVPAAFVDDAIARLQPLLDAGDTIIDGGNSHFHDDIHRAAALAEHGIHYVDVGTSGGIFGADRGYCLMIGGDVDAVGRLTPVFEALAPGVEAAERTPGRDGDPSAAERGFLHCGPAGAGHFVKMVHNGIEYGMMAAIAEGFNLMNQANVGAAVRTPDAETTPLRHPEYLRYDLPIDDIAEVWRRGSVVSSWLLDLTAAGFVGDRSLERFSGRVSDSGEGRWTMQAAVEAGVPVPVLSAAVFSRFSSRDEDAFANQVLSMMRFGFGGHLEKPHPADQPGAAGSNEPGGAS